MLFTRIHPLDLALNRSSSLSAALSLRLCSLPLLYQFILHSHLVTIILTLILIRTPRLPRCSSAYSYPPSSASGAASFFFFFFFIFFFFFGDDGGVIPLSTSSSNAATS